MHATKKRLGQLLTIKVHNNEGGIRSNDREIKISEKLVDETGEALNNVVLRLSEADIPIVLLEISCGAAQYALISALRGADTFNIYILSPKLSVLAHRIASEKEAITILSLSRSKPLKNKAIFKHLCQAKDEKERIVRFAKLRQQRRSAKACTHSNSLDSDIDNHLQQKNSSFASQTAYSQILEIIANANCPSPSELTKMLIRDLNCKTLISQVAGSDATVKIWKHLRQKGLIPVGNCNWADSMTESYDYCYAREAFAIATGRDVVYNPFTGKHVLSARSSFLPINLDSHNSVEGLHSSIAKVCNYTYKGLAIMDYRGLGWGMSSDIIEVNNLIAYMPLTPHTWRPSDAVEVSNLAATYENVYREELHVDEDKEEAKTCVRAVCNLTTSSNLGHFIWNDLGGYALADNLAGEFCDITNNIKLIFPEIPPPPFSSTSYFEQLHPYLSEGLVNVPSILGATSRDIIKEKCPILLKSLTAPSCLARLVCEKNNNSKKDEISTLRVMINVRGHNKKWENINSCLMKSLLDLSQEFSISFELTLEFSSDTSDATSLMSDLVSAGFKTILAKDLQLNDLFKKYSEVDLVIAPVGSALVIPTWIMNKPCIAHGDPAHMFQLGMWPNVAPYYNELRARIYPISADKIAPRTNAAYSNYDIKTDGLKDQLRNFLRSHLRTLHASQNQVRMQG